MFVQTLDCWSMSRGGTHFSLNGNRALWSAGCAISFVELGRLVHSAPWSGRTSWGPVTTTSSQIPLEKSMTSSDVAVKPWVSLAVAVPTLCGPACHGVNCATIQEIARFGLCIGPHIPLGNQRYNLMPFSAPRKAGRRRQDEGKHEVHRPQKFPHNDLRQPNAGDFQRLRELYHYDLGRAR